MLCINQSDPEEKAEQVKMMGSIYAHAKGVMSIIGAPDKLTDFAIVAANEHAREPTSLLKMQCGKLLAVMVRIGFNSYWHRAWVLQEIVLACDVTLCCGSRWTSLNAWETLDRALEEPASWNIRQYGAFGMSLLWGLHGEGTLWTMVPLDAHPLRVRL